jgi:orotidine-5'-phosphate decarboxylase
MKNKLIVALDVNSFEKAKKLVDELAPYVNIFKVGSELFTSSGPKIIDYINRNKKKVFLDLKFYDIPNTVEKAVAAATKHKAFMLTLHASGGYEMLKCAGKVFKGMKKKPLLVAVTVLTSKDEKNVKTKVLDLAKLSKKAGLRGIVCSPQETWLVKKVCGKNFIVVNPGIRPLWAAKGDQKRVTTPEEAIKNGADFIVIGRPITKAEDPVSAVKKILEEIK